MNCPDCGCEVQKSEPFCPKCYARIEPPSLWRRLISIFKNLTKLGTHLLSVKKTVTIKTVDKDGTRHEYHSLAEAPLGVQQAIEKLQAEVMKEQVGALAKGLPEEGGQASKAAFITTKTVSVYRIKEASGKETVYHSLEELPPIIRAAIEKAQGKGD